MSFLSPNWPKSLFDGFPASKALADSGWVYSKFSCPHSKSLGFVAECQKSRRAFVVCLLTKSRPSTVFGAVRAIVVNAINCMPWRRPSAHVGNKVLKPILAEPSLADRDATTAVMAISPIVWIEAPTSHRKPNVMFWPLAHAVARKSLAADISAKTATASRPSRCKFVAANVRLFPARTSAQPVSVLPVYSGKGYHRKPTKRISNQIFDPVWTKRSLEFHLVFCHGVKVARPFGAVNVI